jgi:hypothetical protein
VLGGDLDDLLQAVGAADRRRDGDERLQLAGRAGVAALPRLDERAGGALPVGTRDTGCGSARQDSSASTTRASNWVPAQRCSSASACSALIAPR